MEVTCAMRPNAGELRQKSGSKENEQEGRYKRGDRDRRVTEPSCPVDRGGA